MKLALGLDFGTESVRALLVDLKGRERGVTVARYRHGQIIDALPGSHVQLPPHHALQHPGDWRLESAAKALRGALRQAGAGAGEVCGIGVDFTSCTMLPVRRQGTPLCLELRFAREPQAWPKLWKHHGALYGEYRRAAAFLSNSTQ
jgi:L-ribulokinase